MLTIRPLLTALLLTGAALTATAQTPATMPATPPATTPATPPVLTPPNAAFAAKAASFAGAPATQKHYRAVYQLDSSEPKLINQTLHNMKNALEDPRLKGKLELELVVFSGGTVVFKKDQPYEADVLALQQAGVILAQCANSLKAYKLTKDDMLPYISIVPTGNGELIIRQAEGWVLVHP
ncbi:MULTISPECIES: DsrE family protein [unclassified Hymenobacter]|uniref:DsrE family protein n=1 Tax=unclassified Hymenobacter TaxID=2615202 RepID=UPI0016534824|nr:MULTISPECIES: DsrE family protein [unclassified Hymenobacter]MBC6992099.1 DsrE family protein [Hymenobacter sp. BT491]MCC3154777.1 DsrE family protein [Hymenobacter sp. BT770]MDO3416506.1 DsrE family protein [Hymenobacter sp. BT770]